MATTIGNVLCGHPPPATYARLGNKATLSKKDWVNTYLPILNPMYHEATYDSINQSLAPDQYLPPGPNANNIWTRDPSDVDRLQRQVFPLNFLDRVDIQKEGDTVRDFLQTIALPVAFAWQRNGHFLQRSESGPPGSTTVSKTVDHLYSWQMGGSANKERCQVVGEMKQWGVIEELEWKGTKNKEEMTRRLGMELRGYAYLYNCPQTFVYDGVNLLIVHFKARDKEHIRSANCAVDCWVLPRTTQDPNICTAQYGLYRLVWRGWMRLIGFWSKDVPLLLGSYRREFEYCSGRPFWRNITNHDDKRAQHPGGYQRVLDQAGQAWLWADNNGNALRDQNGIPIWDSVQAW